MIFALNHLLILVITPLLFHYRDGVLSVPVLGKISRGSQWISWSSDTAFIFCFKMTDERRQTLKQSGSQTARCLVRIMFANFKKGIKNKKKLCASSVWDEGQEALWIQAVSFIPSRPCVCHLPLLLDFIFPFLQFPPTWIVAITYSSLREREEAGLAASAAWRAGAVTVLEISSLWELDIFWTVRLRTANILTHPYFKLCVVINV